MEGTVGGVVRLSARLCVQWQDKVVCLGAAPGTPGARRAKRYGRDRCKLKFEWNMPAIAVPDEIASVMLRGSRDVGLRQ